MKQITFNKTGYDPFIDFLKVYCILAVVFCHGFPYLNEIGYAVWGVQIPLFFLIQVFHCYKRETKPINWKMIGRRIVLPFMVIEAIVFGIMVAWGGQNVTQLLKEGLVSGGYGPGSYYPWVYLQMAIIIPIVRPLLENLEKWKSLLVFIVLCELIEIVCSVTDLPDSVYRLLCFRYLMLIWFGWIWVKDGIKENAITLLLSLFSLCVIIYLAYFSGDLEPWLYTTDWATQRWICYFWVSSLFVGIMYKAYTMLSKNETINKLIKKLATASYEIFLVQMAYYVLIPQRYEFFIDDDMNIYCWLLFAFVISIGGGFALNKLNHF